jgi:hypothetical protein
MSLLQKAACLALFGGTILFGQDFASVTGVITDSTKAVLVGVSVTIRNTNTNIARTIVTNEDGFFTITELPPGPYELMIEKPGFETYRESKLVLETGQQLRNDVQMKVGSASETVSVVAEVAPLNTENGQIKGAVIVQQEIQDMPLDGRDFTDIAFLVPGVVPGAQGGTGSMSVNGARADNTGFRLDGFDDRNARGSAAQLRPNIDALEEFRMETSGFSAKYGNVAGGIMNMVLKTGTNQLHGTVFEYLRNDAVDARGFFDPYRLPLHRNQFGATVSGPVAIPKLYDGHNRTFFLVSWESYRNTDGETRLNNVPTIEERGGNFKHDFSPITGKPIAILNPYNNYNPFPGDVIPKSLIDPIAFKVLQWYPQPNYLGTGLNYQALQTAVSNWDSILLKGDHRFSDKDSISVRYSYRWAPSNATWAGSNLGEFPNFIQDNRSLGGISYMHMFSPTLISEARVGFSRNNEREHILANLGQPTAAQLGMADSTTDPQLAGFPLINITNYAAVGFAANEPVQFFVTDYQAGDDLTWIKGKHVVKFGADIAMNQFNQPFYNNSRGTITENGNWSGNGTTTNGDGVADLLLGMVDSSSITAQTTRNYLRWFNWGGYINDDFRITSRLTLNLGLRYEVDAPPHDKYDRLLNFIPEIGKIVISSDANVPNLSQLVYNAGLTGLVAQAKDYGLPNSLVYTNYKNLAPRMGFAWHAMPRTVLRGGYGWFYSTTVLNDIRLGLGTSFPFSTNYSWSRVAANLDSRPLNDPWPLATAVLAGTNTSVGFQDHAPTAYMQNYNLTVEQEVGRGNVVEVSYNGSKGTHLGRRYDVNMPFRTVQNYETTGTFPVPYPPLGAINYWDFGSNSIYSAGQIIFRKRSNGGFFYRLGYTYSKSIDDASQLTGASDGGYAAAIDSRNLKLERGRSDFDRGHVFLAVFSYPLPVGRGKKLLTNANKFVRGAFGDWQLSGTMTAATGQPFTVEDSSANTAIGESNRPNRLDKGNDPTGQGLRGVNYPWFDPHAFVQTASCASRTNCSPDKYGFVPFAPGNSGRNILDGPGLFFTNATLFKNFRMAERRSIQARWEVFNIFNHANFQLPNRNFNESDAGIISNVQGQGRGGPRTMQFALKFIF